MPDQPELRQRLSDALHEHEMLECSWGVEPNDCNCGHGEKIDINDKRWGRGWSDHVADVLLALPGIAITAVPQPVDGHFEVDPDDDDFRVTAIELTAHSGPPRKVPGCRISWGSFEFNLITSQARALAAALLAAVGVAEERHG